MFECSVCVKFIGPRVKPVIVPSGTRAVSYHNEFFVEDEYGNKEKREVDSVGTEILGESKVCPECAALQGLSASPRFATRTSHAKFEERMADPLRPMLAAVVVHNALDRVNQDQKRAQADSQVAVPLVKFFVDNNPKLVF